MPGRIIDLSREAAPASLTTEICVIGSGSGGATAAWDLAAAGHEVVVLEEGADYTGARLTGRDGAMYDQLYMDRGGRSTDDLAISVLQGRVLGGGGVINACDVVGPSEEVLELWGRRHGLSDFAPAAMRPYVQRALAELSASPVPEDAVNAANARLREGARVLGWRGELMLHDRVGCEGLGVCLVGCPADAKRSPRFVAIPRAIEAGATFYTRARAVRIEGASDEVKRVSVRALDERGYHERGELEVRARIVVLAASAVGSAHLLLRSGIGNRHVGEHLSLQPQLPAIGMFDERLDAFRGIPQAFAVTEHERFDEERGLSGFRVEAIMGTPGIVGSLIPVAGVEGKRMMTRYPHMAASLLLVPDEPTGRVSLAGDGRPRVLYEHSEDHKRRTRLAVEAAARLYLAAGAREVVIPVSPPLVIRGVRDLAAVSHLSLAPATAPFLSAHQQGGVRFATSEDSGAADPDGRVYGTRDVYVFDSSGYPTSVSSHTMAPIIAISHLLTAKLLARL